MTSEADRVLAEGVPVRRVDGEMSRLRFSLRSLKTLEDHFGSLDAAADRLSSMTRDVFTGMGGPLIGDLAVFLAAGMFVSPDEALDSVAGNPAEAVMAVRFAWLEAFPAPSSGEAEAPADSSSRGGASTTAPQSSSDEAMTPSGV